MTVLTAHLVAVRTDAVAALQESLNALFAEADDKFFDLSQNGSMEEQPVFFDAMRELRVRREALIEQVIAGFSADFDALTKPKKAAAKPMALSMDSLTLLGEDELDISVAFQSMVARSRDALGAPLEHLRQRIGKELRVDLDVERLPFHPTLFCDQFRQASEQAAVPLKAKLILYKMFERSVLGELQDLIATANQTLAEAGVLPEIKSARPRPTPSRGGNSSRARPDNDSGGDDRKRKKNRTERYDEDDDSADAGAMRELLAFARQAMAQRGGFAMPGPGGPAPVMQLAEVPAGQMPVMQGGQLMYGGAVVRSDVPVQVIAPAELTELLTRLQQLQGNMTPDGRLLEHADAVDVKGSLSELISGEEGGQARALNGADDDVINLVSMLFEFILGDTELAVEIKALIGRLQIPMLKVALLDKNLFGGEDHSARQLVNRLAQAGVGWTRETDDGLYERIEQVVHSVLNDFVDDLDLFDHLLADFDQFVEERSKRMSMIEARLRDREEGQAKNNIAQREVQQLIATRLVGRALPPEVLTLIQEGWQRVLYMAAIREGTGSEVWQQRMKALDVLVWCAQKHEQPEAKAKQEQLAPRLIGSLRKGFSESGFDAARAGELLAGLQSVLTNLLAGNTARTVQVKAEVADTRQATTVSEAVQVLRRTETEVVISAPPPEPEVLTVDARWRDTADNLAPGAWVEFIDPDFKVRAKIAARIRAQDKFIFVNGRGVKIAEKTIDQLAADLASGVARLVSDAALFDRALENMITRLKSEPTA